MTPYASFRGDSKRGSKDKGGSDILFEGLRDKISSFLKRSKEDEVIEERRRKETCREKNES